MTMFGTSGVSGRSGRSILAALSAGMLLVVAACGGGASGDSGPQSGEGLPDVVKVVVTNPMTGAAAFAGLAANKGYELAIKEVNESGFLGDTTIELEKADTKSEAQTAASHLSGALADDEVSAVFGSTVSAEAVAEAALAQQGGLPIIFTQAGSEGVVVGDYTYRFTPMMTDTYAPRLTRYIEEQEFDSIGIIYNGGSVTLSAIGKEVLPAMAEEHGMEVTGAVATQATTQDFRAPISRILEGEPDVVAVLQVGASNPTAMTQLRQAGYEGPVLGNMGASAGSLVPAGEDGAGMVWPADFDYQVDAESTQGFAKAYEAHFNEKPLQYAAEAYDAAWFLAKALKRADSANREALKGAMAEVASQPFTGALGQDLAFADNTIQVPGVLIRWNGKSEEVVYTSE